MNLLQRHKKTIIAHRGIPGLFHENTISSFKKAIELGADMIEFDVRRTKDNILVAFHDPCIDNKRLSELTFSELQMLATKKSFMVPTVQQIFDQCTTDTGFDIELKEEHCENEVMNYIQATGFSNFFFTSFNNSIIESIKRQWPATQCGLLLGSTELLVQCSKSSADMLCPEKNLFMNHRAFFSEKKSSDIALGVWTVDGEPLLKQFLKDPIIDLIITNRCDRAHTLRSHLHQHNNQEII